MDLKLLKEKVEQILKDSPYRLIDLYFTTEEGERYLRVIVDKRQLSVSLDEIVAISEAINDILPDEDEASYTLDVTSTGAEKEIPLEELNDYIDLYVNLRFVDGSGGPPEITGILNSVDGEEVSISENIKGRIKKHVVLTSTIKKIRRAIKI